MYPGGGAKGGEKGEISAELRGEKKTLRFYIFCPKAGFEGGEGGGLALGREPWFGR